MGSTRQYCFALQVGVPWQYDFTLTMDRAFAPLCAWALITLMYLSLYISSAFNVVLCWCYHCCLLCRVEVWYCWSSHPVRRGSDINCAGQLETPQHAATLQGQKYQFKLNKASLMLLCWFRLHSYICITSSRSKTETQQRCKGMLLWHG